MLLQQIANRIQRWFVTAREVDKVRFLDDYLLRDIGVRRTDIERRVKGR